MALTIIKNLEGLFLKDFFSVLLTLGYVCYDNMNT